MNIAIYARVSSEKQMKEGTIDSQIEALKEYAKANNLTISHECIDDGVTGTTLTRPGLDYLRDLIAEGLIEGVLILSLDRLARIQTHQILLMDEFKKQNIQVFFTTQQFEDNAEGNLMLQIQAAVSEYERAKILDRTRRGRKHAVKNGQMLGSMSPYGYRFMPKGEGKPARWEIEPREIEIVRLVFDLYVNKRMKGTQIAKHLESEQFQTRSGTTKWWCSVVYRILKSEAYIGNAYMYKNSYIEPLKTPKSKKYRKVKNSAQKARPRDEWISIPVTPTIEQSLWDAAQALLKQNAHSARRHNNKHEYLVRGLVVCGLCGCIASGYVSNQSTFYSCGARRNKNIHSKPHDELIQVHHKPFDAKIWQGLNELLQDPENMKAQLGMRLERKKSARLPVANTDAKTEKDLEKLDVQEKRMIDAYREGIIDLGELKNQKASIAAKRKTLEAKKKATPSHTESAGQAEITLDMLGDVSARFRRAMASPDFATREKVVNLLVNAVTLHTHKAVVKGNIPVIRGDALNPSNLASSFFCSQAESTLVLTVRLSLTVSKCPPTCQYPTRLRLGDDDANRWGPRYKRIMFTKPHATCESNPLPGLVKLIFRRSINMAEQDNPLKESIMNDKQRAEEIKQRTASGNPATATIVLSSAVSRKRSHLLIVHLVLNVQPPTGDVYRGITDWNVGDDIAASQYQKGQTVAVRIDADNPEIVYPGVPWATFYDPTRDNDLAYKRRLF